MGLLIPDARRSPDGWPIMAEQIFRDRSDAGRALAGLLEHYAGRDDVVVLGIPQGGMPVAYEVATRLDAPLDVFPVRKLRVPGRDDLALGSITGDCRIVLNDDVVTGFGIGPQIIHQISERGARELTRQEGYYRDGAPMTDVSGRTVIVVDDGIGTGTTLRATLFSLRRMRPGHLVVAVPAVSESTCDELRIEADEVVCATTPTPFFSIGRAYWRFTEVTEEEVRDLLRNVARNRAGRRLVSVPSPAEAVGMAAMAVSGGVPSDDTLLELVGDARFVLIGQASHGTHEFFAARAEITRRLIERRGFSAVAVEADWPDAYRVNRYVRGHDDDATAEESLRDFARFPAWMWRNTTMLDFVGRLREHNDRLPEGTHKTGFYGLDLYSLRRSMHEVISTLERVDPEAAARARERYSCFDHARVEDDGQSYGFAAAFGAGETCERQVVDELVELQRRAPEHARHQGLLSEDESFYLERNAATVRAAEEYYRSMFGDRVSSWNLRDRHMAETLAALADHLGRERDEPVKIVVWAHNSHLGDARATEMGAEGEVNLGQLVRERHGRDCRLIGFTTYTGTVTAADEWGAPADRKVVPPALRRSAEELFHEAGREEFLLWFDRYRRAAETMRAARLERAIGVIYRPGTERRSHYFQARLADQFDAVIHIDETRAVEPLERTGRWEHGETPDTYPFAV
jgi:erythromycin esterase-like protein/predicted phosphoribosyltransferase